MTPLSVLTDPVVELAKEVKTPKARAVVKQIAIDPALNEGIEAMMERSTEMRSPMTALLAGIAAVPYARRMWEDSLDAAHAANRLPRGVVPEVVIGSGLTAAIYVAKRVERGYEPPIVLEGMERAGGTFAMSRGPSFFLNSRNRPGGLSIPRNQGALNFLPGAMVQPSDLSSEEYQVNSDLAFAIRSVYALTGAKVITDARVTSIVPRSQRSYPIRNTEGYGYVDVRLRDGRLLRARRVIVASGIGEPKQTWGSAAGNRLVKFRDFIRSLDKPFPLRGMKRVAVIGAGDSGKCVIEALTGQGPTGHMSVASLDWPEEITWYGQPFTDRFSYEECARPRYKRIGTLLSDSSSRGRRVRARNVRVTYVEPGYDCVRVDGQPFDYAIDCTGFYFQAVDNDEVDVLQVVGGNVELARKGRMASGDYYDRIYYIGPAARIPRSVTERMAIPPVADPNTGGDSVQVEREAEVAAYRYAAKTAMFAENIGGLLEY